MQTYDFRNNKGMEDNFRRSVKNRDDMGDGIDIDVDAELGESPTKKSGISNHNPNSATGWHKKLESEDEHIRNIK